MGGSTGVRWFSRPYRSRPAARLLKRAIRTLGWRFSADRMVADYVHHCYLPAAGATLQRSVRGAPPTLIR